MYVTDDVTQQLILVQLGYFPVTDDFLHRSIEPYSYVLEPWLRKCLVRELFMYLRKNFIKSVLFQFHYDFYYIYDWHLLVM